ncbi:MAG: dihydrolipoyl dehydrogenase [Acidithiobacillus sp.]
MKYETVDLLTIGAGGGAYPAAFRLARAGRSVVMVDPKGVMSGNCLYEGCVPSKAIRETAELYQSQQRFSERGLAGRIDLDFTAVMAHKDAVQERRYVQHAAELKAASGIRLMQGTARFLGPHEVVVSHVDGEHYFRCAQIIIASGSEIFIPPLPGADLCLTSHDLYKPQSTLKSLPEHMVVIGGGYIGLETATFFAAFGSRVTLLQKSDALLNGMDPGMVNQLQPLLDPRITILTGVDVSHIETTPDQKRRVQFIKNGATQNLTADVVLMAVGRKPVIPEGTTDIGISVSRKGIDVGPSLQTVHPHIYACGDVNGRVPLFHAAVRQSLVAAHNLLGGHQPLDYADFSGVPTTLFTLPAAAYIGLTPALAGIQGIPLVTGYYDFAEDSRAQILERMEGGIRLFFAADSLKLLGGWVVGIDAGHLIGQIGTALVGGLSAYDLARFADQHPMSAEGISKAARSLF